jgi:hypothetical protein
MRDEDVQKVIENLQKNLKKARIARHIHPDQLAEEYSEEYDAYYNPLTNEWIESKCDDPTCEFCINRPERPINE